MKDFVIPPADWTRDMGTPASRSDIEVTLTIAGDGIDNCPLPVGSRAELRLVHHFQMRDELIAREEVFEVWKAL